MENQTDSHIEIKLTPKGKYYWSIKLGFLSSEILSTTSNDSLIETLNGIDKKLREAFPQNVAEIPQSSTRFKGFKDDEIDF